ncbi:MAG TPA: TrmH family RNA methyltransferase [Aquihabitans sp.]|nr:TrmH family RNA methyltransferase [Aquihabitans sp.]
MSRPLGSTELKRLHRDWRRQAPGRLALLLDSVATPFNVGSILRTAAAMRVDDVWICGQTAAEDHGGTQKTALGSQRFLTFHHAERAEEALDEITAAGYRVVGIELADGAGPIHEVDLSGAVCLAVGHEDRGLSPAVLAGADRLAFIPQLGRIGSLNVATAAGIALYEARRQGWPA